MSKYTWDFFLGIKSSTSRGVLSSTCARFVLSFIYSVLTHSKNHIIISEKFNQLLGKEWRLGVV